MNFGLLFEFGNVNRPQQLSYHELYRDHIELARDAEEMGYDEIWIPEHHFVPDYCSSNLTVVAAIAATTNRIRVGTYVLLAPLHDPISVAEAAATIDVISNGRLELGLGQGYRLGEFKGFDVKRSERGSRLEEAAEIIRRAFGEEDLSFDGRYYRVHDVTLFPKTVQKPHPPMWLGARSRKAIERAARLGYHLASDGNPEHIRTYYDALGAAGRAPQDYRVALLRFGFIASSREKAWDDAESGAHYMMNRYARWISQAHDLADDPGEPTEQALPPIGELRKLNTQQLFGAGLLIGTPDDVIGTLENDAWSARFTHLVFDMALPGINADKQRTAMRLFADEVIPHFRRKT